MGSGIAWFSTYVRRMARSARVSRLSVSYDYGKNNQMITYKSLTVLKSKGKKYKLYKTSKFCVKAIKKLFKTCKASFR